VFLGIKPPSNQREIIPLNNKKYTLKTQILPLFLWIIQVYNRCQQVKSFWLINRKNFEPLRHESNYTGGFYMEKLVKWLVVLVVTGLALSLAGCQKKTETAVTERSGAAGTPGIRDVINIGLNADPGDLSPWGPNGTGRMDMEEMLYQGLATNVNGEPESLLYKEYKLSPDEKYVDIFLYDYIHDSAGNPLKASDVVFSFDKAREVGNIRALAGCEKAEVIDDYTARIYFNRTLFMGDLALVLTQLDIVTQSSYEASPDGMAAMPVSTGPYKVTKYTSGYSLTFEKDPNYWQKDDSLTPARAKANVNTINFYIITESSQMTMALENGSIDMSWHVSNDDLYLFQEGGPQSGKYRIFEMPDNMILQIWLNCDKSAVTGGSADLRRAIYYAINSAVILQSVYSNSGVVTYDIARPENSDYLKSWETEDNYYQYNVDKAKEYLAKAGYRAGQLSLNLLCASTDTYANAAVLVQAFLSQIGIDVKINAVQTALVETYREDPSRWDILVAGRGSATYVTDVYNISMVASRFLWNGTINFIKDDKLQQLIEAAMLQSSHSNETVNALHQYMIENAYAMGTVNFFNSYIAPRDCTSLSLSYKKAVLPGACTYTN
jgi:ABC-type transport system substrate-binding protein